MRCRGGWAISVVALVAGLLVSVAVSSPSGAQAPTCFGERATIEAKKGVPTVGTDGDDVIVGTAGADDIRGGGGDDLICGLAGPDVIRGNEGADRIRGGPGRDRVYGGKGRDLIVGGSGADELYGNSRADTIRGNRGRDEIWGGKGHDTIDGGAHADTIRGNQRDDAVTGGGGHDTISGGKGDDTLAGEAGHDIVLGKTGDDALDGGDGHDTCQGGPGNDTAVSCETTPLIWERIDLETGSEPGLGRGNQIFSVVEGEAGLVAVGNQSVTGKAWPVEGMVWFSRDDGKTWRRITDSDFDDATMYSVTAWEAGFVAVGSWDFTCCPKGAAWISENGRNWELVPVAPGGEFYTVQAGGPGLITAGWVSADGFEWEPIEAPSFGGENEEGEPEIAIGGPGLVAVGDDHVQVSEDGLDWTPVRDDSLRPGEMEAITAGGPGLIAAGTAAWASEDGLEWDIITDGFDGFMLSLATFNDGEVIGVGQHPDQTRSGAWRTHDGQHWQELKLPKTGKPFRNQINTVTAGGPGVVAITESGDVYLGTLAPLD